MRLIEIRELEGPNPYLLAPAIKIEVMANDADLPDDWHERVAAVASVDISDGDLTDPAVPDGARLLAAGVVAAHDRLSLPPPAMAFVAGDEDDRFVVAFGWNHRRQALACARYAVALAHQIAGDESSDNDLDGAADALRSARDQPPRDGDRPEMIHHDRTQPRLIAITGTNGKTTTTRLIAHLLMRHNLRVGWTSTSGIYLNGEQIEEGDWSGPAGARELIGRDDLDWAVLETARGGILRRGLSYDHPDIGAMNNISADHLGDYGIRTLDSLAMVKGTVVRAVDSSGWAVLNADDPRVRSQADHLRSRVLFTTQRPPDDTLREHVRAGGWLLGVKDDVMVLFRDRERVPIAPLADVPITFNGAARHMVENALVATGIALVAGLPPEVIAAGLKSFVSSWENNPGRLNVYAVRSVTYLVDYAHNEAGLEHLIPLAKGMLRDDGRLWLIIGTAGDRGDDMLDALATMAADAADFVIPKDAPHYLRGRPAGEMPRRMADAIARRGRTAYGLADDEVAAIEMTLEGIRPGDVVAVMAVDSPAAVAVRLREVADPPTT